MDRAVARVLVVDDEPQLLKIMTRYLTRLGYGVVASGSTEEAWEHILASPGGYALLLVDMTMPGMRAEELVERVLAAEPETRVIVCSGYPIDLAPFQSLGKDRLAFLHKPFTPEMLAETVGRLLEGA